MITSTKNSLGRLGNQIIRNLAVSLIAEKYNLVVDYQSKDIINSLGINLFSGSNIHNNIQELTDNNYFSILNSNNVNFALSITTGNSYLQTKEITNLLYNYLHTDNVKSCIIEKNPFKERYNTNNDLFIHIRLTDAALWNPGITYYLNTIKTIKFDNLYISTDDTNHDIIKNIFELYPLANLIEYDEVKTIQFGSTCKNILLSHGSFSAIIGYLSFFSNIYYPEYRHPGNIDHSNNIWYGDMFHIDSWISCSTK
jgi:hypothetical protein